MLFSIVDNWFGLWVYQFDQRASIEKGVAAWWVGPIPSQHWYREIWFFINNTMTVWELRKLMDRELHDRYLIKVPSTLRMSMIRLATIPLSLANWGLGWRDCSGWFQICLETNVNLQEIYPHKSKTYVCHHVGPMLSQCLDHIQVCLWRRFRKLPQYVLKYIQHRVVGWRWRGRETLNIY